MPKITWKFQINGTDRNPYEELYGLKFNPFPQHGEANLNQADLALQSLAESNMNPEEIRKRLKGIFTDAAIKTIVDHWKNGEIVNCEFTAEW